MKSVLVAISFLLVFTSSLCKAEDFLVIGDMKASKAAFVLDQLGDKEDAEEIRHTLKDLQQDIEFSQMNWPWSKKPKAYQYTSHAFGYISPTDKLTQRPVNVSNAGLIRPDKSLINEKIKITLDRLRVYEYPGGGVHNVLFDFFAQHQTTSQVEDIHFSQIYRAQEGQGAGIIGYPIFIGLKVGSEGIKFRCSTVNVNNEDDERFLAFLNGDTFKNGLELIEIANPLCPVVTNFATGIAQSVAQRNKNIPVQNFDMGLDFSDIQTRAKLREGSYVVVQTPDVVLDWSQWQFNPESGQVVSKQDQTKTIDLNYVVFSISKIGQ